MAQPTEVLTTWAMCLVATPILTCGPMLHVIPAVVQHTPLSLHTPAHNGIKSPLNIYIFFYVLLIFTQPNKIPDSTDRAKLLNKNK